MAELEFPGYLRIIRSLPCCVCGNDQGVHAHHEIGSKARGTGIKVSDLRTMPLCAHHHTGAQGIHIVGVRTWETAYGKQEDHIERTQERLRRRGLEIDDNGDIVINGH